MRELGALPISNNVQSKANIVRQIEAETQQELNTILPAAFDKAFKGELL